jgi:hypothetical protein
MTPKIGGQKVRLLVAQTLPAQPGMSSYNTGDPFFYPVCLPATITLQKAFVYFLARNLSMSKVQWHLLGQAGRAYQVVKGFSLHGEPLPHSAGMD